MGSERVTRSMRKIVLLKGFAGLDTWASSRQLHARNLIGQGSTARGPRIGAGALPSGGGGESIRRPALRWLDGRFAWSNRGGGGGPRVKFGSSRWVPNLLLKEGGVDWGGRRRPRREGAVER